MKKINYLNKEQDTCLICGNKKIKGVQMDNCLVCGNEVGFSAEAFNIVSVGKDISAETIEKGTFVLKVNVGIEMPVKTVEFIASNNYDIKAELNIVMKQENENDITEQDSFLVFCGKKVDITELNNKVRFDLARLVKEFLGNSDIYELLGVNEDCMSKYKDSLERFKDDLEFKGLDFDKIEFNKECAELIQRYFLKVLHSDEFNKKINTRNEESPLISEEVFTVSTLKFLKKVNKYKLNEDSELHKEKLLKLAKQVIMNEVNEEAFFYLLEALKEWNISYDVIAPKKKIEKSIELDELLNSEFITRGILTIYNNDNDLCFFVIPNGFNNYAILYDIDELYKCVDINFINSLKQVSLEEAMNNVFEAVNEAHECSCEDCGCHGKYEGCDYDNEYDENDDDCEYYDECEQSDNEFKEEEIKKELLGIFSEEELLQELLRRELGRNKN